MLSLKNCTYKQIDLSEIVMQCIQYCMVTCSHDKLKQISMMKIPHFVAGAYACSKFFFDDSHTMYYYTFYFGKKGRVLTLTKIEANFFCLLHIKKLHWTCKLMIQLSRSVPVHFSVKDI